MASSETDDDGTALGDVWLAVRCRVAEASKDLLSAFLFERGARGITEDHPGLDLGDDGPLLSGDPGEWRPDAPSSPDGNVQLTAWYYGDTDPEGLAAAVGARMEELRLGSEVTWEHVVSQDWNAAWKAQYTSFRISPRLWIVPTWEDAPDLPGDAHVLRVDPGMAFGTGTHFTTSGCLQRLDRHLQDHAPGTLLDVGTGTGILALGALLLGVPRADGVDTSPAAVAAARENAEQNHLGDRLRVVLGGVETAPDPTYPVVMANLLAPLLVDLARPIAARVAPGGLLIASGLLQRQADAVLTAFAAQGLRLVDRIDDVDWAVLALTPGGSS